MGREGLADSTTVDREYSWASWHYWVVPVDVSGNRGCNSDQVLVSGSQVTGVPEGPTPDTVIRAAYFDLQGRKVAPKARGIYYYREWYRSGKVTTRRVVWLR